jgi:hypothetical protein
MFWKILIGTANAAFHINRMTTAIGAAIIITVGVHDYLKARKKKNAVSQTFD